MHQWSSDCMLKEVHTMQDKKIKVYITVSTAWDGFIWHIRTICVWCQTGIFIQGRVRGWKMGVTGWTIVVMELLMTFLVYWPVSWHPAWGSELMTTSFLLGKFYEYHTKQSPVQLSFQSCAVDWVLGCESSACDVFPQSCRWHQSWYDFGLVNCPFAAAVQTLMRTLHASLPPGEFACTLNSSWRLTKN